MTTQSIRRTWIRAEDRIRYSAVARGAVGRCRLIAESFRAPTDDQSLARSIAKLCAVARLSSDERLLSSIEAEIHQKVARLDAARVRWDDFAPDASAGHITKAAVIKPYVSPHEKGVIFISFEDQWARLLCLSQDQLRGFAERYTLVVSPTWSPPHGLINFVLPAVFPAPIVSLISNERDLTIIPRLSPNYRVVPLYASSWVNPSYYEPLPRAARDIDLLMVANFGKYKRHHALFNALRQMPADLRVVLVGQPQSGRSADTIRAEAQLFGVADRVQVHSRVSDEFLTSLLCRARASVILSRREGSCVAVAESMFADTPVGLLQDAEIGSRAFVNPMTGRLLDECDLARHLAAFVADADHYSPRAWAERHISCGRSSQVLNAFLEKHALECGAEWTQDIATLCWRPDPQLVNAEDQARVQRDRRELLSRFGLLIGSAE
jgi:glycosyltransferase involved in cell wall biosynthesis